MNAIERKGNISAGLEGEEPQVRLHREIFPKGLQTR